MVKKGSKGKRVIGEVRESRECRIREGEVSGGILGK